MKARRRHELKQNVLDAELAKVVTFFKTRGTYIAWAVVGAILIALIAWYAYSQHQKKLTGVRTQRDRLLILQRNPGADAEVLAGFRELASQDKVEWIAADACVRVGSVLARKALTSQPDSERRDFAAQAATYYRRAISTFQDHPLPVAKAHLGLGKLAESSRDFQTARQEYEAVVQMADLDGYPVVELAKESLANLGSLEAPVRMATTAPTPPTTEPATTQPASASPEDPSTPPPSASPEEPSAKP